MNFKQDTLNQWRRKKQRQPHLKWKDMPDGGAREKRDAKKAALHASVLFSAEAPVGDCGLRPTPKEAALSMQCDPPAGFEGSDLTRLCCAAGKCVDCPDFNRPEFELTANDSIKFFLILLSPLAASVVLWILKLRSVQSA